MKIALIDAFYGFGGAQTFNLSLIDDIQRKHHQVFLIGKSKTRILREFSGKKYALPFLGDADILTFFMLVYILIQERPDVVHTHSHHDLWLGGLAARLLRIPVVHTRHVAYAMKPTALRRFMFTRLAHKIIAVSEFTRKQLIAAFSSIASFRADNIITVPSFSVTKQAGIPGLLRNELLKNETKIVACIGRFVEGKGQKYLIDILPELYKKHPDCCVVFAGDGPKKDECEYRCRKNGLPAYFLGFRSDIQTIFADTYVSVVPSEFESLSFAAMDSLYHGVPVVASNVGGIPEVVEDGKTGILVPVGDTNALFRALDNLLTDTALYATMKNACRSVRTKIDESDTAAAVLAVYSSVTEKK